MLSYLSRFNFIDTYFQDVSAMRRELSAMKASLEELRKRVSSLENKY